MVTSAIPHSVIIAIISIAIVIIATVIIKATISCANREKGQNDYITTQNSQSNAQESIFHPVAPRSFPTASTTVRPGFLNRMQTQISFYVIKRLKHASEKSNSAEYTVPLLFPLILSKPHFLTQAKKF